MKKLRSLSILLLALAAFSAAASAQDKATVTGTVIDPHGTLYASGTISAQLYPPGGPSPTVNNAQINGSTGLYPMGDAISSPGGTFSMSVWRNDVISPAGTQWVFTVCNPGALPPVGFSNICFSSPPISITGDVDISAILNAVAPVLLNIFGGGGGIGTVQSVGLSGPGGIFGITGSPVTTIGVLGFNVTGVSGGGVCFTSTNVISASVLWDTNLLVKGGGVGACPTPSTIFDDGINPPRSPNGLNVGGTAGIYAELQNANPGTVLNRLVCLNGSNLAIVCPDNVTSNIQGVATAGAGNSGTVTVCKLIKCSVEFDNQSVINDFAIAALGGRLHDTGSPLPTAANENFSVLSANAGTGTAAYVAPPGDIAGGNSSGACPNPMTMTGDFITGGTAGACTRLGGAATLPGVIQMVTSQFDGANANSAVSAPGVGPRAVTGTTNTDPIVVADRGYRVDYQTSVTVAVAIGTPASLGGAGFPVKLVNDTTGTNTFVNVTAGGGATIKNGSNAPGATLAIPKNTTCTFYVDAVITQWDADCTGVSTNGAYRVCMMDVGADNGPILVNADLGPQGRQCFIPTGATIVEVDVAADAGTPNIIPGRNHAGAITNLVSSALATAAAGALACSNTGGTLGLDGATTCSATLQNTSITRGDWFELVSGTAGGVAKRMSIAVTYVVN